MGTFNFIRTDESEPAKEGFIPPETAHDIAIIQYTSGTTTKPKGVIISFANLAHNLHAIQQHFKLNNKSVCFSWLPHYHDMGLVDGILTPIFNDCIGILCSPLKVISRPLSWLQIIDQYRVTHTGGPNFFFDMSINKILTSSLPGIDLSSLSHVYVSAEPVRKQTLQKFANHFQSCGFTQSMFTPGYGLAEATLMVTSKELNSPLHFLKLGEQQEYVGLGKPIPEMEIKIIDPTSLIEIEDGIVGEICLHGPSVTPGYFNNEEVTTAAFVPLHENGIVKKFFRTRDLGTFVNGELFLTGRLSETLIIRGLKYQPEDLEYVIINSHLALSAMSCAVFSIE